MAIPEPPSSVVFESTVSGRIIIVIIPGRKRHSIKIAQSFRYKKKPIKHFVIKTILYITVRLV